MGFWNNQNIWFLEQTEKKSAHHRYLFNTEFIIHNIENNKEVHRHQMFCKNLDDREQVMDIIVDKKEPSKIFVLTYYGRIYVDKFLDPYRNNHFNQEQITSMHSSETIEEYGETMQFHLVPQMQNMIHQLAYKD